MITYIVLAIIAYFLLKHTNVLKFLLVLVALIYLYNHINIKKYESHFINNIASQVFGSIDLKVSNATNKAIDSSFNVKLNDDTLKHITKSTLDSFNVENTINRNIN